MSLIPDGWTGAAAQRPRGGDRARRAVCEGCLSVCAYIRMVYIQAKAKTGTAAATTAHRGQRGGAHSDLKTQQTYGVFSRYVVTHSLTQSTSTAQCTSQGGQCVDSRTTERPVVALVAAATTTTTQHTHTHTANDAASTMQQQQQQAYVAHAHSTLGRSIAPSITGGGPMRGGKLVPLGRKTAAADAWGAQQDTPHPQQQQQHNALPPTPVC